jgi:ABC-type transport system involved in multi-copper enzyme maturation permease subunit
MSYALSLGMVMSLGPFLERELVTSVRRGSAFSDRCGTLVVAALVLAGGMLVWDWRGWDRASVAGAAAFALWVFAWTVGALAFLEIALVPACVAPGIASERDRKSLDSLLATRLSAADIVLGTMSAGLLRHLNGLAALVPLLVGMVFLGGIEPGLVLLAVAGLSSTALALASLSAAASATARTASRAVTYSVGLSMVWMCMPHAILILLPRLWPTAARWVAPLAVRALDSSPLGLVMSLSGMIPRGPLVASVFSMIALQMAASAGLVLWAILRLRPASRAAYDAEARAASRRFLRARWWPRPACGDDPVLWHEIHPGLRSSRAGLWAGRLFNALWVGLIAYGVSWFAWPAFAELSRSGYGAVPGTPAVPEVNPIARLLVARLTRLPAVTAPGQARLELNDVLRMTTGSLDILYVLMVAGAAAESVAKERERETWLGLIATPLTGREILRAKLLGSIWKTRGLAALMLVLWTVGLSAGAVHPLGFLAAIAGMGVSYWFLAALGLSASLWSRDRAQATGWALGPLMLIVSLGALPFILPGTASVVLAGGTMPFLTWASLLSYEDVHAALRSGAIPRFAEIGIRGVAGARIILAAWLISTTAQAVGAFLLMRSAVRGFDAAVGRPIPSRAAPPGLLGQHRRPGGATGISGTAAPAAGRLDRGVQPRRVR